MFYEPTQHIVQHSVGRPRLSLGIIYNSETFFDPHSSEMYQFFFAIPGHFFEPLEHFRPTSEESGNY